MRKIMLAAAVITLLTTMTALTSCIDSDNDTANGGETSSAVDEGLWPVPADAADSTYRPGDDFFMFCNGGFWKNTTVDESIAENHCWAFNEVEELMNQRMSAISVPSLVKMKADATHRDDATVKAQRERLQSAIDRLAAAQTLEEAWRLTGQLMKEGYRTPFALNLCSRKGRMGAFIAITAHPNDFAASMLPTGDERLSWRMMNDARLQASLKPLKGGTTRSFDTEKWPMLRYIFEGLGIPLDNAYVIEELPDKNQKVIDSHVKILNIFQNASLEDYKNNALPSYLTNDAVLYSDEELDDKLDNFAKEYLRYERSKAFADAYVTPEMKQRTLDICEEMRKTFRQRIEASTWMSDGSKRNAIEKVEAMTFNVGYPDEWLSVGLPDLSRETTLLDDVLAVRRTQIALMLHLLGQPSTKASFHYGIAYELDFTIVNAFYLRNYNAMNIWPAWLMEPYYNSQANEAFNYATFLVTGHEMTHGFDTEGASFNKEGDLEDIWTSDADRQEFQRRAQQLIDCYNGYEVMPWALPGLYADGAYTVTENIADLGGFLMAYDTYLRHLRNKGFSGEQYDLQRRRFYLAVAWLWHGKYTAKFAQMYINGLDDNGTGKNVHSLFRERVNGIVSNTDDWYELFPVSEKDKLYRKVEDRVRIW